MPEGKIVRGINPHSTVIAPSSTGAGLMSAARHHNRFPLGQRVRRVAQQAASISYPKFHCGTGGRITNRHVALRIDGKAGHPAPETIGGVIERLLLGCVRGNAATSDI